MKLLSKILIPAMAMLATVALPQIASADRVYYLVGVRHVYRIGTDKYFHVQERQQIEEDYAGEVSADNDHYQYRISHGGDRAQESQQLQSALNDLAVERDQRLSQLYPQTDDIRREHDCFNIRVDGPYQVIGVDYHAQVWDHCVAYAPWPGYTCVGPDPYGWSYGVAYTPTVFVNTYTGWYGGWVGFGCPAFVGFYGTGGPIVCAGLSVNVGVGINVGFNLGIGGFFANPGLGGYYHAGPGYFARDPYAGRYIASRSDPRAAMARRAGFASGAAAIRSARAGGFAAGIRAGSRSSFARGGAAGGSFAHRGPAGAAGHGSFGGARAGGAAAAAAARAGYAHSAVHSAAGNRGGSFGARTRGGSFGAGSHVTEARRSTGGGHTATHTATHTTRTSHVTRSTSHGSFSGVHRSAASHSSASHAPASHGSFGGGSHGGSRSFGGGHSGGSSHGGGGSHGGGSHGGGRHH